MYILGDLFEYWLGDDAGIPAHAPFIEALAQLSQYGCGLTVMLGNRDFLLGEDFAKATGATLITEDELLVQLGDSQAVLMHGDTLCTDDIDYQKFRSLVRQPTWQDNFLGQTIDARVEQAQALRKASIDANAHKQSQIMDVNADAVSRCIQEAQCLVLIHGHTHRPAIHNLPALEATRYVVGDWHPTHAKYIRWSATGFEMAEFC
ncbi:MAG: UDP-2,3-diacylglucosamine hydrolase [Granulosicoccus sp.]